MNFISALLKAVAEKGFVISAKMGFRATGGGKQMKIIVKRRTYTGFSTIGDLFLDTMNSDRFGVTLEPTRRKDGAEKVPGKTAIPQGTYEVKMRASPKFEGRMMPHLIGIPGFEHVMFHPGNCPKDTEGCLLLGETDSTDYISNSRVTFEKFWVVVDNALKNGPVFADVIG